MDVIATIFTMTDGRLCGYGLMSPLSQLIFEDAWPKVVDALLTLIFRT
jgi:hypothetical protein